MNMPSTNPRGLARAALERAREAAPKLPGTSPAAIEIEEIPLGDGRVRLVDRRTRQGLGQATNSAQAQRTRDFFR